MNIRPSIKAAAVAVVAVAGGLTAGGTASAEAGNCSVTNVVCIAYDVQSGRVNGGDDTTYRFATTDGNLSDNRYGNSSNVEDDTNSVRNRKSFNRACGYLNTAGASNNAVVWQVTSAADGFVDTDNQGSALKIVSGGTMVPTPCGHRW